MQLASCGQLLFSTSVLKHKGEPIIMKKLHSGTPNLVANRGLNHCDT